MIRLFFHVRKTQVILWNGWANDTCWTMFNGFCRLVKICLHLFRATLNQRPFFGAQLFTAHSNGWANVTMSTPAHGTLINNPIERCVVGPAFLFFAHYFNLGVPLWRRFEKKKIPISLFKCPISFTYVRVKQYLGVYFHTLRVWGNQNISNEPFKYFKSSVISSGSGLHIFIWIERKTELPRSPHGGRSPEPPSRLSIQKYSDITHQRHQRRRIGPSD